ncbi:Laccase [Psilocybe cubensis]|uniref:Laccase n=1 Tax=Psilocybe cubensis TaxID=181762 RepID=A0ACB8H9B3_PSICU|nr:Laccase [Psilocybe cubensis]KAH9484506.1 Laccase [Psilocybe cubensis]
MILKTLKERYMTTFPKADSTLINGKGRYPKGKPAALSVVNVEYGKRYRLRLISITCDGSYTIFIDKHPFTVIEADGQSVVPVRAIDALTIFAGQRYSVVIVANQPIGNYWIRAQRGVVQGNVDPFEGGLNSAILRYKGAEEVEPVPIPYIPPNRVLRETELHALIDPEAPGKPEQDGGDVNLHFSITYDEKTKMFLTNGKYFQPPKVPVLLQLLSGTPPEELLPEGSIFTLPRNKTISISMLPGEFDTPHPFHLHGHTFSVVRSANTTDDPAPKYNYRDPVRRDTVNLGKVDSGSNVTIRFRTDNPGPWIFHCHVDWHLERGMAIVFAEAPEEARKEIHPPEEWHYLCPVFDNLPESLTSISTVAIPPPTATTIEPTPFINLL